MPKTSPTAANSAAAPLDFPSLLTVAEVAARTRIPEGGWRWLLFHRESNGLSASGAVVRVGRKILLDENRVRGWLAARRETPADVARARGERQRRAGAKARAAS